MIQEEDDCAKVANDDRGKDAAFQVPEGEIQQGVTA